MVRAERATGDLRAALAGAGLRPGRRRYCYRRAGLRATVDRAWLTFTARGRGGPSGVDGEVGPGLWKDWYPGRARSLAFDVPLAAAIALAADRGEDDGEDDRGEDRDRSGAGTSRDGLRRLIAWAAATREGQVPENAPAPPSRAQVVALLPGGEEALSLRSGPLMEPLSLEHGAASDTGPRRSRLRLGVTLARAGAALAPRRLRGLELLAADGAALRMVRLVLRADPPRLDAEVDLSGAPAAALPLLLPAALAALRQTFTWFAWPASILTDTACRSAVLDGDEGPGT